MPHCSLVFISTVLLLGVASSTFGSSKMSKPAGTHCDSSLTLDAVQIDWGGAPTQEYAQALAIGLVAVLTPTEEPEAPWANARDIVAKSGLVSEARIACVVHEHLERDTTHIELVTETRGYLPERGEDIQKNWVFSMVIPSISDHIYWIIVPRSGEQMSYVYGFN